MCSLDIKSCIEDGKEKRNDLEDDSLSTLIELQEARQERKSVKLDLKTTEAKICACKRKIEEMN